MGVVADVARDGGDGGVGGRSRRWRKPRTLGAIAANRGHLIAHIR